MKPRTLLQLVGLAALAGVALGHVAARLVLHP